MRSTRIVPSTAPLERAYLVGITLPRARREDEIQNLAELELLARSAGAEVVGRTLQSRTRVDGTTFVGSGKIEELAREIHDRGANLVIFDDDLTPAQARNIEKILEINVIDRTELILDIFSRRARTRQARIQVEIAQLNYALPRLRRLWEHLGRQAGGIGTRGPGETQIEVDRRKARDRISSLEKELEKIHRGAEERRKRREGLFTVTIVGYTNAGKSTLLNRIAGSGVLESDRLFSTLDSTTRRVTGPGGEPFLLTDTIGFIRKLPTHLVDSFKVTLLDVREADLLLHVADASIDRCEEHIAVVNAVLDDVLPKGGAGAPLASVPSVLVLNKIDLIEDSGRRNALRVKHPEAVLASAATGEGTEELLEIVESRLGKDLVEAEVSVSPEEGRVIALVERSSKVLSRRLAGDRMVFRVRMRKREIAILEREAAVRLRLAPSS
ncbi:MAG: GTPase HflX [Candidatus Krumholzibacteria bacterium]|nr:GTPase HflX [Candidatus Krumholzibacteria bacterium]